MTSAEFKKKIAEGIPAELPELKSYDQNINHAPKRKDILDNTEKRLAIKNALRYFPEKFHQLLAKLQRFIIQFHIVISLGNIP